MPGTNRLPGGRRGASDRGLAVHPRLGVHADRHDAVPGDAPYTLTGGSSVRTLARIAATLCPLDAATATKPRSSCPDARSACSGPGPPSDVAPVRPRSRRGRQSVP